MAEPNANVNLPRISLIYSFIDGNQTWLHILAAVYLTVTADLQCRSGAGRSRGSSTVSFLRNLRTGLLGSCILPILDLGLWDSSLCSSFWTFERSWWYPLRLALVWHSRVLFCSLLFVWVCFPGLVLGPSFAYHHYHSPVWLKNRPNVSVWEESLRRQWQEWVGLDESRARHTPKSLASGTTSLK